MCCECFGGHGGGLGPSMGLGRTAKSESIHAVLFDRSDDFFVFSVGLGAESARTSPSAKLEPYQPRSVDRDLAWIARLVDLQQ